MPLMIRAKLRAAIDRHVIAHCKNEERRRFFGGVFLCPNRGCHDPRWYQIRLPLIEGRGTWRVIAADLRCRKVSLLFLDHPDNLHLGETALPHAQTRHRNEGPGQVHNLEAAPYTKALKMLTLSTP